MSGVFSDHSLLIVAVILLFGIALKMPRPAKRRSSPAPRAEAPPRPSAAPVIVRLRKVSGKVGELPRGTELEFRAASFAAALHALKRDYPDENPACWRQA